MVCEDLYYPVPLETKKFQCQANQPISTFQTIATSIHNCLKLEVDQKGPFEDRTRSTWGLWQDYGDAEGNERQADMLSLGQTTFVHTREKFVKIFGT